MVEGDIDGDRSEAVEIESHDARFGGLKACRRLARTIFLGSAPTTASQSVRGIDGQRVLLGVLQPGQQISIYKDALRRLSDRLHYLNTGDSRFWFDVRPNLRREMEDRKRRFTAKEHLLPEVQNRLRGLIHGTTFAGIHIFTSSADVPDDWKMHLVILPPTAPYSRGAGPLATKAALEILNSRGDQPRMKRNRLLFLAADAESTARLDDLVCSFKAWESIVKDIDLGDLNLDQLQSRQANKNRESAAEAANRTIRETYRWLLAPTEEAEGKGISAMRWESFPLNTGSDSFTKKIERVLREHELVIETWAPDPLLAKKQFADIVDEIVQQFTTRVGDQVQISVELHAQTAKGFDAGLERTVRENCRTLKFKSFDFEAED